LGQDITAERPDYRDPAVEKTPSSSSRVVHPRTEHKHGMDMRVPAVLSIGDVVSPDILDTALFQGRPVAATGKAAPGTT
jgi:hypothetical protein